jgi:hypothetical protein
MQPGVRELKSSLGKRKPTAGCANGRMCTCQEFNFLTAPLGVSSFSIIPLNLKLPCFLSDPTQQFNITTRTWSLCPFLIGSLVLSTGQKPSRIFF